ncbi:GH25 family lysozyme [Bacillus pseudomycoides]|uniref:GH25 family lysozyme n=1 Tax=Bacillus pseudomycoides TaxID=64104 RepID=UPI000BED4A37|nr:GH25 family lysozyme [Bacillus pseudomycoides]PEB39602.1 N-acetylmuramoyl-L-alanine amidase [Bacillus pseudomycoides]PGD84342.1 N-acetylmuramoyl-L-alanine amidase [Bacillus pseudomycoides]PGE00932.1 N-acetylmuramoyl-L-alanine amidase [Bacillus pseudomycoides]PHE72885.1 N-acetylmuramoyl-L-alanine amidase [Bacillus pseudomycoides]PHG20913.1 N-acetylmuramoyl-L-alanine amidase [Bacillus pseudomycoides]
MGKHIIDISKWNGNIDWDVVAPQIDLAICRVQYGSRTVDERYTSYVTNLEQRGISHAAYAYGCYVSVKDAIVEAKDFMARVSANAKFLVLDVEDDTLKSCGPDQLAEASQAFIDTCKAAGWKVGLYVGHHMYNKYGLSGVRADFLWIPRYGGNKPAYPCDIWQYTETGNIDGIGKVDLNYLVSDKSLSWFIDGTSQVQDNLGQPVGIGIAISKYPEGYRINLYKNPEEPIFTGHITNKIPYLIFEGYWGGGDKDMIKLGNEKQWVKLEHFDVEWFHAYSNYPVGYGINYYAEPECINFKGLIDGSSSYRVWARKEGAIDIGQSSWIKEEQVVIK